MIRYLIVGLSLGLGLRADGPREADEVKKLQGSWQVVEAKQDGKVVPEATLKQRKLVFEGDRFTVIVAGEKKRVLKYMLDPGRMPKWFDVTSIEKNETAEGIYELKGDELKLCYGNPGDLRPMEFTSTSGSRLFLLVLKRDKR